MSSSSVRGEEGRMRLGEELLEMDIVIVNIRRWLYWKSRWQVPWRGSKGVGSRIIGEGRTWGAKNLINSKGFSLSSPVHRNRVNYVCLTMMVVFSSFYSSLADRTRNFKGYTR